jgi:hypothetical protein
MRVWAFAAVALLASAGQSAMAWSPFDSSPGCTKGMLWPYVRNPGDCLTEAEIQAGQRGVYNGPVNTNPNIGAVVPAPQPGAPVVAAPAAPMVAAPAVPPIAPAAPVYAAPAVAGYAQPAPTYAQPAPVAAPAPVAVAPQAQATTSFSCTKGALWPFVKKPGDCLTSNDKKNGQKGVVGGGSGLVVNQVNTAGQPVVYQQAAVNANGQVVMQPVQQPGMPPMVQQPVMQQPGAQPVQPAAVTPACTKGVLWPFVREPGDCPTSSEQKRK